MNRSTRQLKQFLLLTIILMMFTSAMVELIKQQNNTVLADGFQIYENNPPEIQDIGHRTEDPGPFLYWPVSSTTLDNIIRLPDSPWTHNFLGISNCPPYPALVDDGYWTNGVWYPGQFENYALPGTTKEQVKWFNNGKPWPRGNAFACYDVDPHAGTDIVASNGTAVYAAASGVVHAVQSVTPCSDGGNQYRIIIRHDNVNETGQRWYTIYLHVTNLQVSEGQSVSHGTYIANVGCSHLHFETSRGTTGYHNNRNHWGIDQAPWTGCLWIDQNLCPIVPSTPTGHIDAPTPGPWRQGTVRIQGWAKVDGSAINRVEIWINGVHRSNATYGTSRPDVGGNYGYYWDWSTAQYPDGTYNVRVKAVASNGTSSWLTANNSGGSTTLSVKTDNNPPTNPRSVNPGCQAANNVWQNTCNDPNFTWSGASDGNGIGIKDYQYYWGTNSAGAPTTYTTNNGVNPPPIPEAAAIYFLRVAARDQLNQQNPNPTMLFVLRYDSIPPVVGAQINNGSSATNQINVTLNLTASDVGSGVDSVRVSNNGLDWSNWQPYQDMVSWTLPALNRQMHTVYVQARDKAGNISETASATITLDLYPVMPHSTSYRICTDVVNIGGQTGLQSGSYRLTSSIGESGIGSGQSSSYRGQGGFLADLTECLPIEHAAGEAYEITNWVFASGGSLRGSTNYLLGDTAGEAFASDHHEFSSNNYRLTSGFWANVSTISAPLPPPPPPPPTATPPATPTPGPTPTPVPGGFGITINDGALYTNSENVTARVSAPNVTQMRLSNDGGYNDNGWMSYQTTTGWTISTFGNYVLPRFVYVWFRDAEGIVYGAYMDDIIYDPIPPEGSIALFEWEDSALLYLFATDDNSGVAEMRISEDPTFANVEWQEYEQFLAWERTGNPVYAQFRDRAGNMSPTYSTELSGSMHRLYLPTIVR
jgi:murein DD-endopeptidase MepM/ murein hydrolase activator NlpD